MKKYTIKTLEIVQKDFQVIASSREEAISFIKESNHKKQITIIQEQCLDTKIDVITETNLSKIEALRYDYPSGCRIKCLNMNDPYHAVPSGTMGTVNYVDDAGTIHMNWDNGQSLGLIPGEDSFQRINY